MKISLEPPQLSRGILLEKNERLLLEFESPLGEEEGWVLLVWESGFEEEEGRE